MDCFCTNSKMYPIFFFLPKIGGDHFAKKIPPKLATKVSRWKLFSFVPPPSFVAEEKNFSDEIFLQIACGRLCRVWQFLNVGPIRFLSHEWLVWHFVSYHLVLDQISSLHAPMELFRIKKLCKLSIFKLATFITGTEKRLLLCGRVHT